MTDTPYLPWDTSLSFFLHTPQKKVTSLLKQSHLLWDLRIEYLPSLKGYLESHIHMLSYSNFYMAMFHLTGYMMSNMAH